MVKLDSKIKPKELIISLALPLATGGLSAFITKDAMKSFNTLHKPPLSPQGWVFPVAWTGLYILMGAASYLVYTSDASKPRKDRALTVYVMQLAANFGWSIVFFSLNLYLTSFIWLLMLWVLIFVCTILFFYIRKSAGKLMIPYLLWVSFAAYLNLGIYLLN